MARINHNIYIVRQADGQVDTLLITGEMGRLARISHNNNIFRQTDGRWTPCLLLKSWTCWPGSVLISIYSDRLMAHGHPVYYWKGGQSGLPRSG